ncbi:MAG: zf-HC2 domain-containing protein [Planctomycetota bacterium]
MKPVEQSCDMATIDDYLAGKLDPEKQTELEQHLSDCETCRLQIEQRAADQDVWDNARSLLSDQDDLPI